MRDAMNAMPGHTTLFSKLRHAAMTQDGRLLFVHAGIDPARTLQEQGDAFWWSAGDILGLTTPFERFSRVIRGFDRDRRGLVQSDFAISLDAGAGRGGPLLAAAFAPSGEVLELLQGPYFQQPARFCDVLTALFAQGSELAAQLLVHGRCRLEFDQTSHGYRIPCTVTRLPPAHPRHQATYWHNRLFNEHLPPHVDVLAFTPDWVHAGSR